MLSMWPTGGMAFAEVQADLAFVPDERVYGSFDKKAKYRTPP